MKTPETGKDIHVLRKTPEVIKKGLAACSADECHGEHKECPYQEQLFCIMHVCGDALAYIRQLESRFIRMDKHVYLKLIGRQPKENTDENA